MTPHDTARPDETISKPSADSHEHETVHPHYAAPPPSREIAGEPRILHALTIAAWVGKLIDPLLHHSHEKDEARLDS
jgi:hypothetical protein